MKAYSIFSVSVFVILLISMFSPWIQGKSDIFSIGDILLNINRLYDWPGMIEIVMGPTSTAIMRDAVNLYIFASILFVFSILASLTGIRYRTSLLLSSILTLLSAIIFVVATNRMVEAVKEALGSLGELIPITINYSYGLYLAFIAGGLAIIGYLIPQKQD